MKKIGAQHCYRPVHQRAQPTTHDPDPPGLLRDPEPRSETHAHHVFDLMPGRTLLGHHRHTSATTRTPSDNLGTPRTSDQELHARQVFDDMPARQRSGFLGHILGHHLVAIHTYSGTSRPCPDNHLVAIHFLGCARQRLRPPTKPCTSQ